EKLCADTPKPAKSTATATNSAAAAIDDRRVMGSLLRRTFSMARTLLSRLDERAMAAAGRNISCWDLKALARSTSSVAYVDPSTPVFNTASSHACSPSSRGRRHATHTSGLNQ